MSRVAWLLDRRSSYSPSAWADRRPQRNLSFEAGRISSVDVSVLDRNGVRSEA